MLCSDMVSESLREPRKSRKDIIYAYSEPSRCFLTVSIAPFVKGCNDYCVFKLFVKILKEKMIKVRAGPPFPCLRPGLGIDRSRHGPFTLIMMISWYKKFSVKKLGKNDNLRIGWLSLSKNLGQDFQNKRSGFSEQNSCLSGSIISELGKW